MSGENSGGLRRGSVRRATELDSVVYFHLAGGYAFRIDFVPVSD